MNWQQIETNIKHQIKIGADLNTQQSTWRKVLEGPDYACSRNRKFFKNAKGYKIQIGSTKKEFIEVPFEMLRKLYEQALLSNKVYNRNVFKDVYDGISGVKGCFIHTVGRIFEVAGIAQKDDSDYKIII